MLHVIHESNIYGKDDLIDGWFSWKSKEYFFSIALKTKWIFATISALGQFKVFFKLFG